MPSTDSKESRAVTCEDWDEATESPVKGSRITANVTKKRSQNSVPDGKPISDKKSQDGSDSGYSSKTNTTTESLQHSHKKGSPLALNTTTMEDRLPQPYAYTMTTPVTPSKVDRRRSVKAKEGTKEKSTRSSARETRAIKHDPGQCQTCDTYGYHIELPARPATAGPVPLVHDPRVTQSKPKDDNTTMRPKNRRDSSSKHVPHSRPVSMLNPLSMSQAYDGSVYEFGGYAHQPPQAHPINWLSSSPGIDPGQLYPYGISPHPQLPSSYNEPFGFFESPMSRPHAPQQSVYNQYIPTTDPHSAQHQQQEQQKRYWYEQEKLHAAARQRANLQKSAKDIEEDRKAMPPPARKPDRTQTVLPRRPSLRRASTEKPTAQKPRPSSVTWDDEDDALVFEDDEPLVNPKRSSKDFKSHKGPTSWKGIPSSEQSKRPPNRKSVSYTSGSTTVHPASSHRDNLSRRSTDPANRSKQSLDQYIKEAEAYQDKVRGEAPAKRLPTESIRDISKSHTLISEAGTQRSHQPSSQGSVRGRRSSTAASISQGATLNIGGISVNIEPDAESFELYINGVTVSRGPDDLRPEYRTEYQTIERAPSTTSRGSRRSRHTGHGDDVALTHETSRNSGYYDNVRANSGKRSSRAASTTRRSHEHASRPDAFPGYDWEPESWYGGRI